MLLVLTREAKRRKQSPSCSPYAGIGFATPRQMTRINLQGDSPGPTPRHRPKIQSKAKAELAQGIDGRCSIAVLRREGDRAAPFSANMEHEQQARAPNISRRAAGADVVELPDAKFDSGLALVELLTNRAGGGPTRGEERRRSATAMIRTEGGTLFEMQRAILGHVSTTGPARPDWR